MNTAQTRRSAPQQLPVIWHIAVALGVAAVLALGAMQAREASHQRVQTASKAISNGPTYVTLGQVQVVGRREAADKKAI